MKHELILFVSVFFIAVLTAVFVYVYFASNKQREFKPVKEKLYGYRPKLFTFLILMGFGVAVGTLFEFPVAKQTGTKPVAQSIKVTGYQWYWVLDKTEVYAGEPVEFMIDSADVNHGFGIYDEDLVMHTQGQAMPQYTNRLVHTFKKTGTYKLLCLEFCGIAHHNMVATLTVLPAKE